MIPNTLIARALSRLLSHDDAARRVLAPHAGETLTVRMPPSPFATSLRVTEAGDFAAGDGLSGEASVTVEFPLAALPLLAQGREAALRSARVNGNAGLLQDISRAFTSLPLAAEAELERVLGPVLGNEAARFLRALKALGENAQSSLHSAGRRYLHDEAGLVAERDDVAKFAADLQRLRIDVQRLQARLAKLA
ncbi:MAG: hypothetical protein JNL19_13725 [Burkholderiales bacterium]|nr:hypothetical protein [Burkholderiales bacterium]